MSFEYHVDASTPDAQAAQGLYGTLVFLRGRIMVGLLFLAPFILTFIVFKWLYDLALSVIEPLLAGWSENLVPGAALAILMAVPLVIGIIAFHVGGRWILATAESTMMRLPVVGPIFVISKQLFDAFDATSHTGFNRVVEIQYPRPGAWTIGFLTSVLTHEDGEKMGVVYMPTAPLPNSGWVVVLSMEDIYDIDMSVSEAMRFAVSGGLAAPSTITRTPATKREKSFTAAGAAKRG